MTLTFDILDATSPTDSLISFITAFSDSLGRCPLNCCDIRIDHTLVEVEIFQSHTQIILLGEQLCLSEQYMTPAQLFLKRCKRQISVHNLALILSGAVAKG